MARPVRCRVPPDPTTLCINLPGDTADALWALAAEASRDPADQAIWLIEQAVREAGRLPDRRPVPGLVYGRLDDA